MPENTNIVPSAQKSPTKNDTTGNLMTSYIEYCTSNHQTPKPKITGNWKV